MLFCATPTEAFAALGHMGFTSHVQITAVEEANDFEERHRQQQAYLQQR